MSTPTGFRFSYWKQGTPNTRLPAVLSFSVESSDITNIGGKLYDENNNLITTSYEGLNPVIESANRTPFVIPISIINTVRGAKFAGYTYELEILNNDTPSDIFLQSGSHTSISSGKIQGDFIDSVSDVDTFNISINPEVYLCKISEQPHLVPTNIQTTTGTEGITTVYHLENIRDRSCIRVDPYYTNQITIPLFGGTTVQVIRHDSVCYNSYRNTIIRQVLPQTTPSSYTYFTLQAPTQPINWENEMEIVIPMKIKRTIELYFIGSNLFGHDITTFNLIIQVSRIRDLVAS